MAFEQFGPVAFVYRHGECEVLDCEEFADIVFCSPDSVAKVMLAAKQGVTVGGEALTLTTKPIFDAAERARVREFDLVGVMRRLVVDEGDAAVVTESLAQSLDTLDHAQSLQLVNDLFSMMNIAVPTTEQAEHLITEISLSQHTERGGDSRPKRERGNRGPIRPRCVDGSAIACGCARPGEKMPGADHHVCSYFGRFDCAECGKRWTSAYVWSEEGRDEPQACRCCGVMNMPTLKQVQKFDDFEEHGEHDTKRCGMCIKLGRRCDGRTASSVTARRVFKVIRDKDGNQPGWARQPRADYWSHGGGSRPHVVDPEQPWKTSSVKTEPVTSVKKERIS